MAATIVLDDEQEDGNQPEPKKEQTQEASQTASDTPVSAQQEPAPKPKSKFDGKSREEIEAAYMELERKLGSQGAELGELRKLVDGFVRSSLAPKQDKAATETAPAANALDDETEFFTNPKAAIKKVLRSDETILELLKHREETQADRARRLLKEKHADAESVVQDAEFQEWVKASPVRTRLFVQAHQGFDVDAADELLSTFKQLRQSAKLASKAVTEEIVEDQKKAAAAPRGTAGAADNAGGKPIYSRRKIMELMLKNPEEYAARNDEFLAAYAEGRVRP